MNVGLLWLLAGLSTGLTSSYTTRVMTRSGLDGDVVDTYGLFRVTAGAFGFFAVLAILAWGFVNLPWWWVVLAFLGVSLAVVPLAFGGRGRIPVMVAIQPVLDVASIGIAVYLWVWL